MSADLPDEGGSSSTPDIAPPSSTMLFDKTLVQRISSNAVRLPPNFVGVRPHSTTFLNSNVGEPKNHAATELPKEQDNKADKILQSTITFTITDPETGETRRMTKKEKKRVKRTLANEKREIYKQQRQVKVQEEQKRVQEAKRKRKAEKRAARLAALQKANEPEAESASPCPPGDITSSTTPASIDVVVPKKEQRSHEEADLDQDEEMKVVDSKIMSSQLALDEEEMQEEKGKRQLPAILNSAMAWQLRLYLEQNPSSTIDDSTISSSSAQETKISARLDDDLSRIWIEKLEEDCFRPADEVRAKEDLRPMAYKIVPEVWRRFRPATATTETTQILIPESERAPQPSSFSNVAARLEIRPKSKEWCGIEMRPQHSVAPFSTFDRDSLIVFDYLHKHTHFHASCGSKFGCDFLLYDGPRTERHAFAGLRILSSSQGKNQNELPLPTAYSMTAFVRTLNTAGKIALVATVLQDSEHRPDGAPCYRISIVDLALEKILTAPTHRKRARTEKRKEIGKNLSKKSI